MHRYTAMDISWGKVISTLFVMLIFALAWYVLKILRIHHRYSHIPGPVRTSFFLGNISAIKSAWQKTKNMNELFYQWTLEHGKTFVMYWGSEPVVLTVEPQAVKAILVTENMPKSKERYSPVSQLYGERFVGTGFAVQIDNEKWKMGRSMADPVFHKKALHGFVPEFNSQIATLMDKLGKMADGEKTITLLDEFHNVTLDVIAKIAFSVDIGAMHDRNSPFSSAIFTIMAGYTQAIMDPFWMIKFWSGVKEREEVRLSCRLLRATGRKWLRNRIALISRGDTPPDDILTHFIKTKGTDRDGRLNDEEELIDDIVTIFVGGQETTANTLAMTVLQICRHPHVLERICEEIDNVMGARVQITVEDLSRFTYIEAVVKETLRVYPVGPMIFRKLTKDKCIGGFKIPKGTNIVLSMYASGRFPEFHKDALEFRPERFLNSIDDRPGLYTNFPFSLGPRMCIGKNFGMMETKMVLCQLFKRFTVRLDPNQSFGIIENGTLRPIDHVRCTLSARV